MSLSIRPIVAANTRLACGIDGMVATGGGADVLEAIASENRLGSTAVLKQIVTRLLVHKGCDWTSVILGEYMGLFDGSTGTFTLVWDNRSAQLVAHGAVFQSALNPSAALVAHIRTHDEFRGMGLGTLVTEEVVAAAFRQNARFAVLATDDKLNRAAQGERAAYRMYSRIGFTILAEKRLADTVDWLMAIDEPIFAECQRRVHESAGQSALLADDPLPAAKRKLLEQMRSHYNESSGDLQIEPVRMGDLAQLFLLLNLHPRCDFQLKLNAWAVHYGPEFERAFVTMVRPAIADRDRLHDASLVLRKRDGAILAVCAAQQVQPFTRRTFAIDFYCVPKLLDKDPATLRDLVCRTITRIDESPAAPQNCVLSYTGIDEAKIELFKSLGFIDTGHVCRFYDAARDVCREAGQFERVLR